MRVFYLKIIIIFINTMFVYIVTFLFKNRIIIYKPKQNSDDNNSNKTIKRNSKRN